MSTRSERHHEIPEWLLKHFRKDHCKKIWMGFKDTSQVKLISVKDACVRHNANTTTRYQEQGDGTYQPVRSDRDETILERFDDKAARAADEVINFSRQWRDNGPFAPKLSPETMDVCKQLIVSQARRTRESQDRIGLGKDKNKLYLDLLSRRAEETGHQLPSREGLIAIPGVTDVFDVMSHNHRAKFASGDHPILRNKETEFLVPLGLNVAVIDLAVAEFIIGSHGITIIETAQGENTWLPLAPDVAISFSDSPGFIGIGICAAEFVEYHNRAAASYSDRIVGFSKEIIQKLLTQLD